MATEFKKITLPKHTQKCIHWYKDGTGKGFILIGYCPDTLAYFNKMMEMVHQTFPEIDPADMTVGKVRQSRHNYGFTILAFDIPAELKKVYKGWEILHEIDFTY